MRRNRSSKVSKAQSLQEMAQGKSRSGPDPKVEPRIRLLPVDPYLIHAYWEIIDKDLETARSQLGSAGAQAKLVLRFYDITYILFDGKNARGFFDVEIGPAARNWYVQLWSPEKSYCADLGLKTSEGRFLAFVRSNVTHTPPAWPSIREEERHMRDNPEAELITECSPQLSIPSRGEFTFPLPGKPWDKPEYLLNGKAPGKERTGGEPGRLEGKGASRKVKELNPAVPFIDRKMRNFDLAKLNEQHFCRSISSWRPQSKEE